MMRRLRGLVRVTTCLALLTALGGTALGDTVERPTPGRIEVPEAFSFRTVQNWVRTENTNGSIVRLNLLADPGRRPVASYAVYIRPVAPETTPAQMAERWKEMQRFKGQVTYLPAQTAELDGEPTAVLTGKVDDQPELFTRSAIAVRGGKAYILNVTGVLQARATALPNVLAMEKSFKWLNAKPEALVVESDAVAPATAPIILDVPGQPLTLRPAGNWSPFAARDGSVLALSYGLGTPQQRRLTMFRVLHSELRGERTLEDRARGWMKLVSFDQPVQYVQSAPTRLDGAEAMILEGTSTWQGVPIFSRAVVVAYGRDGYLLNTFGPIELRDALVRDAQELEQSVKWSAPARPLPPSPPARPSPSPSPAAPEPKQPDPLELAARRRAAADTAAKNLALYDAEQANVRFNYPSAWRRLPVDDPANAIVLQLEADRFDQPMRTLISVGRLDTNELIKDPKAALRMLAFGKRDAEGERTVAGQPGYEVTARTKQDGQEVLTYAVAVEFQAQVYVFILNGSPAAVEAWQPAMTALVDSVQWVR